MKIFERIVNHNQLTYCMNLSQSELASSWKCQSRKCVEIFIALRNATSQCTSRGIAIDECATFCLVYREFRNRGDKQSSHFSGASHMGEGLYNGKAGKSPLLFQK
jgi:hypothetical protein